MLASRGVAGKADNMPHKGSLNPHPKCWVQRVLPARQIMRQIMRQTTLFLVLIRVECVLMLTLLCATKHYFEPRSRLLWRGGLG